jgi:single-stranded DNA-binding protein
MPTTTSLDPDDVPAVNLVVLRGLVSAPPETRRLPSGGQLATLSVRVPGPTDDRATSAPVAVWDPPAWLAELDVDDPVVVVGRLQRRFFQSGGATASRVEVVASLVGRGRDRRRLAAAERHATAALGGLE